MEKADQPQSPTSAGFQITKDLQMRIAVGIVGEGGIKADTWYRISDAGQLVEAAE